MKVSFSSGSQKDCKMRIVIKWIEYQLDKKYTKNFLIRKPVIGTLVFFLFAFCFVVIYQPLQLHRSRFYSFDLTMLFYCVVISLFVLGLLIVLKRTNCFSKNTVWTISKELLSIFIVLTGVGLAAYFAGFIIEEPVARWNISTFFDSFSRSFLVALIPVLIPSLYNIRCLFTPETILEFNRSNNACIGEMEEVMIHIESKAKKEELCFYPSELIYVESDGNYVVFHLIVHDAHREVMIRNSISNIEQQLSSIPYLMRVHRAFIINLKKVASKRGNSLGYQLEQSGSKNIIPVSRQNTQRFDQLIKQYQ